MIFLLIYLINIALIAKLAKKNINLTIINGVCNVMKNLLKNQLEDLNKNSLINLITNWHPYLLHSQDKKIKFLNTLI